MARELVGIREAVRGWHVSERALRRRLTTGEVAEAERADDGSWLMPSEWLDEEFDRSVIDLRDPIVSEGLAAVLNELTGMTEQVKQAEVRAAVAEAEIETVNARLRHETDQLDKERAEHQRLQHDHVELQQAYAIQGERLQQAEAETERAWETWDQAERDASERLEADQALINRLTRQLERNSQKMRLAESMTSRRKRRSYERLAAEIDKSLNT